MCWVNAFTLEPVHIYICAARCRTGVGQLHCQSACCSRRQAVHLIIGCCQLSNAFPAWPESVPSSTRACYTSTILHLFKYNFITALVPVLERVSVSQSNAALSQSLTICSILLHARLMSSTAQQCEIINHLVYHWEKALISRRQGVQIEFVVLITEAKGHTLMMTNRQQKRAKQRDNRQISSTLAQLVNSIEVVSAWREAETNVN